VEQFPKGSVAPFSGPGFSADPRKTVCPAPKWREALGSQGTRVCIPNYKAPFVYERFDVQQVSPIRTQYPQIVTRLPSPGNGILDAGLDLLKQVVCSISPPLCNILSPGSGYPTADPRTPAPLPEIVQTGPPGSGDVLFKNGRPATPGGYHWNKGTYWTKQGVVFAGTKLVKNRRMNPLNPRALSRAIRRGDTFVRFAKSFGLKAPERGLKKRSCRR